MKTFLCHAVGLTTLLSIHVAVNGGEKDSAMFSPEEALKAAVYFAAHPREISLERIQQLSARKLLLSDCSDYDSLRQCTYTLDKDDSGPGLQSVTVSSTMTGASRGGLITWQFSPTPCVSGDTVAKIVGTPSTAPALPPTVPQPFASSEPMSQERDYRIYESKNWDRAATLYTVSSKCLETLSLNVQLPKE